MDFTQLTQTRYSCRKFSNRPIEDSKIENILEAVRNAPSAVNFQPIHVWVVRSSDKLEKLKKCTKYHFDAPCILIFGYFPEKAYTRRYDGKNFGEIDCTIAATQAMLQIHNLGLESTWVGAFDPAAVRQNFPECGEYTISALFPLGYASEDAEPAPQHSQRKSLEELTTIL